MSVGAVDPIEAEDRAAVPGAFPAPAPAMPGTPGAVPGDFNAQLASALNVDNGAPKEDLGDPKDLIAPPAGAPGAATTPDPSIVPSPDLGPPAPQPATDSILASAQPAGAPPADEAAKPLPKAEEVIAKQGELDEQKARDAMENAERDHMAALEHEADVNDALQVGNAGLAKKQKYYDDSLEKYNAMKPVDYFDEPSHNKFTARIGVLLGGLGAGLSAAGGGSSENRVLTQLNKQIDDDHRNQVQAIDKARDSVVMARTGINDAKEAKASLIEDANAKRVASLGAYETEARRTLAERGIPQAQIDADGRVLALQAARVTAARQADEQKRKDALADAQIAYLNARAGKLGRKGGGGSGGTSAIVSLQGAVDKGASNEEIARIGKASGASDKAIEKAIGDARANDKTNLRERGEVVSDVNQWKKDNDFEAKSKKATELDKLSRVLQGDKVSGLDKAFILQEAEKAAKGGTATVGGVNIDMAHMAGGGDKLNQIIAKWKTGDFSDAQSQALVASLKNQAQEARQQIDDSHNSFQETFRDNPRYASDPKLQDEVNKAADRMFSIHGYSRKPAKAAAAAAPGGGPAPAGKPPTMVIGNTVYKLDPNTGLYR